MTQIGSTLANNAGRSRQAEDLAHQAVRDATAGSDDVSQLARTMGDIEASGRKMAEIIGLIDSIAFQTNILALNAAVEAARAGQQGRGFAVVASEVRSLAQRSADAARDIRRLIQRSVASIESGAGLVQQTSHAMTRIVDDVRRVSTLVEEIALATAEQSQGVSQVEGAVSQLDQVTQQNAALVEQGAASAEALKHQAVRLAAAVAAFSEVPA
jgi:methyl-accepting chemotaxis protein